MRCGPSYNVCTMRVQCVYNVCTMCVQCVYNVCTMCVQCVRVVLQHGLHAPGFAAWGPRGLSQ